MLSESRKYGLAVHLTNQYFAQLPKNLQDAVLGNVGTLAAFTLGAEDAEILEKQFYPITRHDLINLSKYNFYLKLMANGQTSETFSAVSLPPIENSESADKSWVTALSRLAYGKPRDLIEEQIKLRRQAI